MSLRPSARHTGTIRRVTLAGLGASLVVGGLVAGPLQQAQGAYVECAPGVNVFHWDGSANDTPGKVGDGVSWGDAYNWDKDCIPGLRFFAHDDDVTIPSGASVVIGDGGSVQVAALHNNGTITVVPGGTLITLGPSTSKNLVLEGTLAGNGTFTVTKSLQWIATDQGGSTMETRWCYVEDPCDTPTDAPATTIIKVGATLTVSGRGVNLSDQRIIENHGKVTVSGNGYFAADYGTVFKNLRSPGVSAVPTFTFANDGGYYQGFATAGLPLGTFVNTGKLTKTGGIAFSIVDATYTNTDPASSSTGTIEVHAGKLSILTPNGTITRLAKVQQGFAFGNGGPDACDAINDPASCATVQATPDDPEVTTVELTQTGTTTSNVTIQELAAVTGYRGVPVRVETPNAKFDATHPMRFRIYLDASTLAMGEVPADVAQHAIVQRSATLTGSYANLPDCGVSQNPTTMVPTCVARTLSVNETNALGTGDVVIVISSLQNSRYRVSKTNG